MKYQKQALEAQAKAIHAQLSSYTNNVALGIGSFVEKPGFPYVDRIRPYVFCYYLMKTINVNYSIQVFAYFNLYGQILIVKKSLI